MLQKNQITTEGFKILEKAAQYRFKGFRGSDEFVECYKKFCKETDTEYQETSASDFKVYVLKYGVRNKFMYTESKETEVEPFDIATYRTEMLGAYYANR